MNCNVIITPLFRKLFKTLLKKYPSLKGELQLLTSILKDKPRSGVHLGQNIYKIRLAIASKGKGKSSGARVITYLVTDENEVYLIYIYDKSQLENITTEQILKLLRNAGLK